jgi:hypothetical protein
LGGALKVADREDLIRKLREVQSFKPGAPLPEWAQPNQWGPFLSKLCGEAADAIEGLEADLDGAWMDYDAK